MKISVLNIIMCLFLGLILTINGCENDSLLDQACGIKTPSENIGWLKNLMSDLDSNLDRELQRIEVRNYNSKEIIILTWKLNGIQDAPTGSIYNCEGELLYHCGGNQPVDSCSYVISNSQHIGFIWTNK